VVQIVILNLTWVYKTAEFNAHFRSVEKIVKSSLKKSSKPKTVINSKPWFPHLFSMNFLVDFYTFFTGFLKQYKIRFFDFFSHKISYLGFLLLT
jgi:hypothetical protein